MRTRLDPIISPGKVSGHVHNVAGSSAFTADMDFTSANAADVSGLNARSMVGSVLMDSAQRHESKRICLGESDSGLYV